jgi:hypothetical protein
MKEHKIFIIILFIFLALPIPFSLLSWLGTLLSIANISMVDWSEFSQCIQGIIALITMLLAGTYLITYAISLEAIISTKKVSIISFLPILHIILFSSFLGVWMLLNEIYK